ncbi:nicotinamide riboside kinase 1 [Cladorrhinum samala]|uniref:Nicotinamide riboside kinase 1 n=1 Tax=Cladorrhinum samala TaxID=585594 RepID=A0AAV9HKB1_9PEZI|nr:nicotinamide riboside kinase 1 [Cladorrhinum samala]
MAPQKAIIISISGCSSSGKTTLAGLLRDIFPNTFILHEDDFYRAESELPTKSGLLDWDCPEALDLPELERALLHIRSTGTFPDFIDSKEDLNSVGPLPSTITPSLLSQIKSSLPFTSPQEQQQEEEQPGKTIPICILDGFLLYTRSHPAFASILRLIDVKLFLLADRATAVARRQNRDGYVTLEGFWTDPPGYVEKIVWPNYVEHHKWLFEGEDVEAGKLDEKVCAREGISFPPLDSSAADTSGEGMQRQKDFGKVLEWAVGEVLKGLEAKRGESVGGN